MVAGLVYRASADDSATLLGSADLVAKEQYERAVTRYELGLIKGHITQSAGELYDLASVQYQPRSMCFGGEPVR